LHEVSPGNFAQAAFFFARETNRNKMLAAEIEKRFTTPSDFAPISAGSADGVMRVIRARTCQLAIAVNEFLPTDGETKERAFQALELFLTNAAAALARETFTRRKTKKPE
jgi:hypothetical protein